MKKILINLLIVVFLFPCLFGSPEGEKEVKADMLNALRSKTPVDKYAKKLANHSAHRTAEGRSTSASAHIRGLSLPANLESAPDRIIVKFKKGKGNPTQRKNIETAHKINPIKHISIADIYVYKLSSANDKRQVLEGLKKNPVIEYAEPDYTLRTGAIPNDSYFSQLWGMHNTGQTGGTVDADIDAAEAWDITTGNENTIVAVIDTGVDYTHQDLAANMWQNPGEVPGDGIDNDDNGYVDDVYGINSITGGGDPMDDHSHGTHCAGTIGAVGNDGVGVAGVCWNVKIMALKFLSSSGSGYTSDAITCIEYAIAKGAHVMSNSWGGGGYSQSLYDVIEAAGNAGILFIAAAGNSGSNTDLSPHYPSSYSNENIISVAATDHNDQLAGFSCYGPTSVDVAAPGVSVYSSVPGNSYAFYSGTSMATPHVAGLAALIKSNNPSLTWWQIKETILGTVDEKESLEGKILTAGRVNAFYALTSNAPPAVTITAPQHQAIVSGMVLIEADASDESGVAKVEFYIDGVLQTSDNTAPWQHNWDTSAYANDNHLIKVIVYDQQNRTAETGINVQVNNTGLPGVIILNPIEGEQVMGSVVIQANASYDTGLTNVEFYIDDTKIGEDTVEPYETTWNSLELPNGSHVITVKALGSDGKVGEAQITITTNNIILPEAERNALIALYNSTNGDNWTDNTNWKKQDGSFNDPGTEHTWYGIYVENNHVEYIYLPYNNLTGTLPPELGNLSRLQDLALYWNYIGGSIPPELGNLGQLGYLDFDDNELTGSIPPELGNLSQLYELWLNDNNFSSGIPPELGNLGNLEYLYLWNSQLTGSIPPELGNLTRLLDLSLEDNNLTGGIPSQLGNLSQLNWLSLYWNQLSGTIPPELGNLNQLVYLDLDDNDLSGGIPAELGNLTNLQTLWLSSNRLTGPIPPEFANMSSLKRLYLFSNQLSGIIPLELGDLSQLQYLDLTDNNFTGIIPPELANLNNLQTLWLSNNQLTGTLPVELTNLVNLKYLILENNELTGSIPPGLGNLNQLILMSLQGNELTGGIPRELSNLGSLLGLWLNNNHLSGGIPSELGNLIKLKWFYVNSNSLKGLLPTSLTNLTGLSWTDIGYNSLYTDDTTLRDFLNSIDPDWQATQTIAPANVSASPVTNNSIALTWIPIPYTQDPGKYRVLYSITAGGPYSLFGSTTDKSASSLTVTGLVPNTTYYFVLQTRTEPHDYNSNRLDSEYSVEAAAVTPGTAYELTITSPVHGDQFETGTPLHIDWTFQNLTGDINIHLYKGDSFDREIGTAPMDDRSFIWNIPVNLPAGDDYKIRIYQDSFEDYSEYFSIVSSTGHDKNQPDFNGDGNADILWRYNGTGGFNVVWLRGTQGETASGVSSSANSLRRALPSLLAAGGSDIVGDTEMELSWQELQERGIADGFQDYDYPIDNGNNPGMLPDPFSEENIRNGQLVSRISGSVLSVSDPRADPEAVELPATVNTDWKLCGTGDFNADSKVDLVWRNVSNGNNVVWLMDGVTLADLGWLPATTNLDWTLCCSGDFNGDGKPDLVWRNVSNGKNVVWYMDGLNRTGVGWLPTTVNLDWVLCGAGDFNNDGKPDLVWRNVSHGKNVVWFMDGVTMTGVGWLPPTANLDWTLCGTGDFNNDGKTDLLWRNAGNGKNAIWYMDGLILDEVEFLTAVTDTAWKIEN